MSKDSSPSADAIATPDEHEQSASTATTEEYGDFPPGTIVLAKLKSFPPWPAIVIPDELIPAKVLASKPKNPSRPSTQRGKRKSISKNASVSDVKTRQWCVRFLRDDTFMWATSSDISLLTKDQINAFLESKRAKKMIKMAYEMALDPPDVEEFIEFGSDGKPLDIDNEANDDDFQDDEISDVESEEEDEEMEDAVDDDNDLEIHTPSKKSPRKTATPAKRKKTTPFKQQTKKSKTTAVSKTKKTKKETPVPELDPDTSSDEDWDVDVDPTEEPVCTEYPDLKAINDSIKKRVPLFKKARLTLQKNMLAGPEIDDLTPVKSTLDILEKLEHVEVALVSKSHLNKVMFSILKRPDLQTKELKKIRERIATLVREWYDMKVDVKENWTFDDTEEQVESNTDETLTPDISMTKESTADVKDESDK